MADLEPPTKIRKADVVFFAERKTLFTQANKMFTRLGTQVHISLRHNGGIYEYTTTEDVTDAALKTDGSPVVHVWTPKDFRKPIFHPRMTKNETAVEMEQETELTQFALPTRRLPVHKPVHEYKSTRRQSATPPPIAADTVGRTTPGGPFMQATTPPPPPPKHTQESWSRQRWLHLESPSLRKQQGTMFFGHPLSARPGHESGPIRTKSLRRLDRYAPY